MPGVLRTCIRVRWEPGLTVQNLSCPALDEQHLVLKLGTPLAGRPYSSEVEPGQSVRAGDVVATSDVVDCHAPVAGKVVEVSSKAVVLVGAVGSDWPGAAVGTFSGPTPQDDYPRFLAAIGLLGMGGSMFPASVKLRAGRTAHTLVVNGVECEPGVTIDRSVLVNDVELVQAGIDATAGAVGAERVVIAVKKARTLVKAVRERYVHDLLQMGTSYPAGAEKLIVCKLAKRMPATGELPFHMGYIVQNVTSLRAIGRAVRDGMPVVERPLTVAVPGADVHQDVIVPAGAAFGAVLARTGYVLDREKDCVVAGGLMMGRRVGPDDAVTKGTTALFVLPRRQLETRESACIRCGSCFDACPLKLHPVDIVERIDARGGMSTAPRAQLRECFLCGACASVCPARIPLAERLRGGKSCLAKQSV